MNAEEIRLAFYAGLVFTLVGVGFFIGDRFVTAEWNAAKVSADKALQTQQQRVIAAEQQRDKLQDQVETSHAQILATGKTLTDNVAGSLSAIEAAVRSRPMSGAMGHPPAVSNPQQCPAVDPRIADSFASVADAIKNVTVACINVDADRSSILALAPKP
jgi:hypothetical protein